MARERFAAFISYAHCYQPWVGALQRNLEAALGHLGRPDKVFLDDIDLGTGRSWLGQLQAGLADADAFVLVATPEALASRYVTDEFEAFIAGPEDWRGRLHVVQLVDAPMPPLLRVPQWVDFTEHDEIKYREALRALLGGLIGRADRRGLPDLPPGTARTPRSQMRAACCAAGPGASMRTSPALPTASTAISAFATTLSVFGWYVRPRSP